MNFTRKPILLGLALGVAVTTVAGAEEVPQECRGIAAGVVASMRASGEVTGDEAIAAAILAARRGCAAVLEAGLRSGDATTMAPAASPDTQSAEAADDDPSLWEMLTRSQERKPGNDRLRRLKQ